MTKIVTVCEQNRGTKQHYSVEVEEKDTVLCIKKKLQKEIGVPTDEQILLLKGRQLPNDKFLTMTNYASESMLQMIRTEPQINFKTPSGDVFPLKLPKNTTIQEIKAIIRKKMGINTEGNIILNYLGAPLLDDSATLQSCSIPSNSTIDLYFPPLQPALMQKKSLIEELERQTQENQQLRFKIERLLETIESIEKETAFLALPAQQSANPLKKAQFDQREQKMQIHYWKCLQQQAQHILSLNQLNFISKIGWGCDAVVFQCSANLMVQSVALKILFNYGIDSSRVYDSFAAEFEILQSIPMHPNIIPILNVFQDRPTQQFLDHFPPDLVPYVVKQSGDPRSTICIVMPLLHDFDVFLKNSFKILSVHLKLEYIVDIASGLLFLYENDVVHRDIKIGNLLINSSGRIIITDFGCSIKLSPDKTVNIPQGGSIGGNPAHMASEIKQIKCVRDPILVDYSKQPSFELGVVAFEIFFGDFPDTHMFGEHMDDAYFNKLCVDDSHTIPEMFEWLRGLLHSDPQRRTALCDSITILNQIREK